MTPQEFYEANATNVCNVPRPGHPEDPSGWAGVRRASEARFVAGDCLVMTLADAFDFAEKYRGMADNQDSPLMRLREKIASDDKIGQAYERVHEHARTKPHQTIPVQVWADIDVGIADLVRYLNTVKGVRTDASCQGTESYPPYVMAAWNADTDARLRAEFEIETLGEFWGYIRERSL